MVVERYYKMGAARSKIRELFEYGMAQAAIVGKENVFDFSIEKAVVPHLVVQNNEFTVKTVTNNQLFTTKILQTLSDSCIINYI